MQKRLLGKFKVRFMATAEKLYGYTRTDSFSKRIRLPPARTVSTPFATFPRDSLVVTGTCIPGRVLNEGRVYFAQHTLLNVLLKGSTTVKPFLLRQDIKKDLVFLQSSRSVIIILLKIVKIMLTNDTFTNFYIYLFVFCQIYLMLSVMSLHTYKTTSRKVYL